MDTSNGKLYASDAIPELIKNRAIPVNRDLTERERMEMQIKIYSPCGCGSGKKFKFCCYKKT